VSASPHSATDTFDVFVSYVHADQVRVAPIVVALEEEGLKVWLDRSEDGIREGESITGRLNPGLEQSGVGVAMIGWRLAL